MHQDEQLQDLLDKSRQLKKDCIDVLGKRKPIKEIERTEFDHIKNALNTLEKDISMILQVEKYKGR